VAQGVGPEFKPQYHTHTHTHTHTQFKASLGYIATPYLRKLKPSKTTTKNPNRMWHSKFCMILKLKPLKDSFLFEKGSIG
jgi:hypothetical protein